jgi:hypothetical protein
VEDALYVQQFRSTLPDLKTRRASTRAKISVARLFLEGCKKRALKGQAGVEELEIECRLIEELPNFEVISVSVGARGSGHQAPETRHGK